MKTFLLLILLFMCVGLMTASINKYFDYPSKLLYRSLWILIFPFFLLQMMLGVICLLLPGDGLVIQYLWSISLFIYTALSCFYGIASFFVSRKCLRVA